jgi:hypothetical protein
VGELAVGQCHTGRTGNALVHAAPADDARLLEEGFHRRARPVKIEELESLYKVVKDALGDYDAFEIIWKDI